MIASSSVTPSQSLSESPNTLKQNELNIFLRLKKSNRKQWHNIETSFVDPNDNIDNQNDDVVDVDSNHSFVKSPTKDDKWWKYEVDSDDGHSTPTEESTNNRWCKTDHIKTIKGKRRRKKKSTTNEQGIYSVCFRNYC